MTKLTAMIIQGNGKNIRCAGGGPSKENGKWVGWITLWKNDRPRELLSSDAIYDTEKEAKEAMEDVVKKVRESDLGDPFEGLYPK